MQTSLPFRSTSSNQENPNSTPGSKHRQSSFGSSNERPFKTALGLDTSKGKELDDGSKKDEALFTVKVCRQSVPDVMSTATDNVIRSLGVSPVIFLPFAVQIHMSISRPLFSLLSTRIWP